MDEAIRVVPVMDNLTHKSMNCSVSLIKSSLVITAMDYSASDWEVCKLRRVDISGEDRDFFKLITITPYQLHVPLYFRLYQVSPILRGSPCGTLHHHPSWNSLNRVHTWPSWTHNHKCCKTVFMRSSTAVVKLTVAFLIWRSLHVFSCDHPALSLHCSIMAWSPPCCIKAPTLLRPA